MSDKKNKLEGVSIRTKITLIFAALILFSLILVGFAVSHQTKQILSAQVEEHLGKIANQKSQQYKVNFERIRDEIRSVVTYTKILYSRNDDQRNLNIPLLMPWTGEGYGSDALRKEHNGEILKLQRISEVLNSIVTNNPFISLGYFGTKTSITVFDNPGITAKIEKLNAFEVTQRPWFIRAKKEETLIWTKPYIDANTKNLIVTCAAPVYHKTTNQFLGVVGFDVLLTTIQNDILALDIGYDSYAFLVDSTGKVLVRPGMTQKSSRWDESYNTSDLLNTGNESYHEIIEDMLYGSSGLGVFESSGEEKYLAYAPILTIGGSLGIVASKSEVVKPVQKVQLIILGIIGIVFFIFIGVGLIFGSSITRPIKELTMVADMMSKGQMNLDILPETRKDELGVLTKSINRLVTSLKIALSRKATPRNINMPNPVEPTESAEPF